MRPAVNLESLEHRRAAFGRHPAVDAVGLQEGPHVVLALVGFIYGFLSTDFGLLVLGSPDATRYSADMGVDFLIQVGDVASAALARLLD